MNKAKELFDKILVDGQEIDLQELDTNNGIYSAGSQKTLKVDFVLKKKDEIPAKIFTGLTSLKSVVVPQSVKTIGERAFANTGAEVSGLEQVETFGEGALVGVEVDAEIIEEIQKNNPEAFIERYTAEEAAAYNAKLQGAVKAGDDAEERYIDDYENIEYIYNEATWNASYANGIMKKYYETYPDEDWYNQTDHRAANFNDKAYDVDIYEDKAAIYTFESYDSEEKTTKYGEGKVKVIEMRAGGATVEVIENSTDQSFVGQKFNVATALATNNPIQLYTLQNEPVNIWVTVELESEAVIAETAETPTRTGLSFKAGWVSDTIQKITNRAANSSEVYYTDIFYSLDENKHELFIDANCETSAGKFAKFNEISYPDCVHCWEGVVSAPGAKLPWIGAWFEEDLQVTMIFQYEGKEEVKPWNPDKIFGLKANGHKEWGFASPATEFRDDTLAIEQNGGENGFDINKFHLRLEKLNVAKYTEETAAAYNAKLQGAVKAGDIKVEPQEKQDHQENQTVNGEVNSEDDGNTQIYNGD